MLVIVDMMFIAETIEIAKMMFVVKTTYMICRDLMLIAENIDCRFDVCCHKQQRLQR
jgi:hypothetical protein